ncbi:transglutaminaseTgpA domain-containing protein [Cellulomonas sp. NPDC057328]|uniref:transglutaminase family protein n=1 Tax=Cellulomonas sp. NPDC057328 TaxID=3346101 RepID=UPI003633644D
MNRPHGPEQGVRAVVGTALAVAATWAGLLALGTLIAGRRWFVVACAAVLLVAVVTAVTRALTRTWWAPTAVGAAVAVVGLVLRYGAPPGRPQFLPDPDAFRRTWALAREGVAVVNDSFVPMPDVRPGELLVVVGALAVLLLVDLAVVALRVPALSGLALVALWVPGVLLGFPAGGASVFWAGVAYLALLAYGAAPQHAHAGRRRRVVTTGAGAALVATVALVAGPPLMDVPGWASVGLPQLGAAPVGPLELSDQLDLRESLGARSAQEVLRYSVVDPTAEPDGTDEDEAGIAALPSVEETAAAARAVDARLVGPLRAFTLTTFDGRTWERTEPEAVQEWDPTTLLSSDAAVAGSVPDATAGTLAQVDVVVGALRERRLPVSTHPRTVQVPGDWSWDPRRDEVVGEDSTDADLAYSMLVQVPQLTADELRGAPVGTPPDAGLYTAVPDTEHRDDVERLVAELTADADTPYAQAMALQGWLRSASNFTYDTRVPPARTSDAVWDFLESRRGYCVQFATAMTVMARMLDIPARVGVGFLPGERTEDGSYVVTGRLAHAWPELYFEGQGWVRFEPTPASQTGAPPTWADPFTGVQAPGSVPEELTPGRVAPAPAATATAPATSAPAAQDDSVPWPAVALTVGLGVLVLGGGATVLLLSRRGRRVVETTPERAWAALRRDLARLEVTWSDAATPRGALRDVQRALLLRAERTLDGPALAAFEQLVAAVESGRYAPTPRDVDPAALDGWVAAVRDGVTELLGERPRAGAVPRIGRSSG